MNYQMKIVLESDICVGNGESRGNAIDLDLCKDAYGIPYIPARRLKGCLRETAEFLKECGYTYATEENIEALFGNPFGTEGALVINDALIQNTKNIHAAIQTIRNENLPFLRNAIHPENVIRNYTSVRGQTRLEDGLKDDGSLRFTRVLTQYNSLFNENDPVSFISYVSISNADEDIYALLDACCKGTRHIGSHRNRGLGNVTLTLTEVKNNVQICVPDMDIDEDQEYRMTYTIQLDSPVSIPDFGDSSTTIPARSVIGCMGGYFARINSDQEKFRDLFLNGKVQWSALTPMIQGEMSQPVPVFFMKLKNGGGRIINCLAETDGNWKRLKPKNIEGSYSVSLQNGFAVADVRTRVQYHNNISKGMLYTQEAIDSGYIYGGTVTFPGKYYQEIVSMLRKANLRFGRSRKAQYANCYLISMSTPVCIEKPAETVSGRLYAVLESDMIAMKNSVYLSDAESLRSYIAEKLGIADCNKTDSEDMIRYGLIGGFQNLWHLQKMHIPTVKAGSLFCFETGQVDIIKQQQIGEYRQEGFGTIHVYTETEMSQLKEVTLSACDVSTGEVSEESIHSIKKALLKQVVRETLMRYARDYSLPTEDEEGEKIDGSRFPVSRLRLMLQDTKDYAAFMEKVKKIKESDASSEKESRQSIALKILNDFYGAKESIDWQKLLGSEEGLYEEIIVDPELKKMLYDMWALPLINLLHHLHYNRQRENRTNE